jgi:6-pyruvoyltetrahydropterin/6-carboxytetrahydropterin synthase
MTVAKTFRWEGAHRLPWHDGLCSNLHGHSYRMIVEIEGSPDNHGMVIDFNEIKKILSPLVEQWDHATLVHTRDTELLEIVQQQGWKHFVLPYDSTSENVARFAADYFCTAGATEIQSRGLTTVRVIVQETRTCQAEYSRPLKTESG